MFLAFSSEQLCSDLSRKMKSLLSLNRQVLKVFTVKFPASTLDQCHHLLINLFCKNASKPLNAVSARSAVCFLQPILQLSKKSSRLTLRLRLYCIYTLWMYTNTARSIEAEQRLCSEATTSEEVGLLQNFRAFRKWTPFPSNFWAINLRM